MQNQRNSLTLVLGASENPSRYSYLAIQKLLSKGHQVIAVGKKAGRVDSVPIITEIPLGTPIDTVTLYLNPTHQQQYIDTLLKLKPRRIIFNPGTENPEFMKKAMDEGIYVEPACTLVMLSSGTF